MTNNKKNNLIKSIEKLVKQRVILKEELKQLREESKNNKDKENGKKRDD